MSDDNTQISAFISSSVKEKMERYVRSTGVKKGHLVEQAILHHLNALEEIPQDFVIPTRVVLSAESAKAVRDLIERPKKPTKAMSKLFDDR